jgi:hypothetical protein
MKTTFTILSIIIKEFREKTQLDNKAQHSPSYCQGKIADIWQKSFIHKTPTTNFGMKKTQLKPVWLKNLRHSLVFKCDMISGLINNFLQTRKTSGSQCMCHGSVARKFEIYR